MKHIAWIIVMTGWCGCHPGAERPNKNSSLTEFPQIMTTYRLVTTFDRDFKDMAEHGIEAVDIGDNYMDDPKILEASRKYGIQLLSRIEVPMADHPKNNEDTDLTGAVMMGGAYKGKAVDRFTFGFEAKPQKIILERPVYHRSDIYDNGKAGHYMPGVSEPRNVEIFVKKRDFDGEQHIQVLPATFSRLDQDNWEVAFDLTDVEGDLEHCIIAAYWVLDGGGRRARNNVSARDQATLEKTRQVVLEHIATWKKTNRGEYPKEIIGIRLGDEEWNRAAHTHTTPAASYPIWDYSNTSIAHYHSKYPWPHYPRGKNFVPFFGRMAYAQWMYDFHEGKADLVHTIKEIFKSEGLERLKIYRNTTRGNVFAEKNDHDGSGQELLSRAFDFIHLDPYPVRKQEYTDDILVDMAYMSGFARRFNKPLIPWMQAHQYYPDGYFGLTHPNPEQLERMLEEHRLFSPDGMMWLGYGKKDFNTFPLMRPDSWEKAGELHARFKAGHSTEPKKAEVAVVRPYTVRALRGVDSLIYPQDLFFTETIIKDLILNKKERLDPFEPLAISDLEESDLQPYSRVMVALGILGKVSLQPLAAGKPETFVFIEGCELQDLATPITGILGLERTSGKNIMSSVKNSSRKVAITAADIYNLDDTVTVLAEVDGNPVIWKKNNLVFMAVRGKIGDYTFADFIWNLR